MAESPNLGGEQKAEVPGLRVIELCDGLLPLVVTHCTVQTLVRVATQSQVLLQNVQHNHLKQQINENRVGGRSIKDRIGLLGQETQFSTIRNCWK